ncbi:MAG TPA: glycosyltransferase family 4 protein [Vicinamibacteria bacterium]|nr:glycosyltransferase family 4 protein [Vicinamibacteria bacterium]
MRVLAWVPYPLGKAPGQRYRIEQWAPYLREAGIDIVFQPFADERLSRALYAPGRAAAKAAGMAAGLGRRFRQAWQAERYDAVLLQREGALIGPAWSERLLHARQPAIVYDFDDAVYLPYVSPTNRYLSYLKFPWKTAALCRMASAVVAGNDHLAEYARRYNGRVSVVPSTVSLREYRPRPEPAPDRTPVVGWTGSHSSLPYLSLVKGPLQELRRRRAFTLLLIGVDRFDLPGVEVECRPWSALSEVRDLWDMDVGIMPLPDEPWARGKCGMKAIQYMGVGIPAVVSPVGANREIVADGVTGFHAATAGDWVETLDRLLGDPGLRRRLGSSARDAVAFRYSAEAQAPRVAEILRSVAR